MLDPVVDFAVACDTKLDRNTRHIAYAHFEIYKWADAVMFKKLLDANIPEEYKLAVQVELERRAPKKIAHPFSAGATT